MLVISFTLFPGDFETIRKATSTYTYVYIGQKKKWAHLNKCELNLPYSWMDAIFR